MNSAKTLLMVAFHFPPLRGSSGLQRTLGFARYLPDHGWRPVVLAPTRNAYQQIDDGQLALIPPGLTVERALCLDTKRHLSISGRYLGILALPDPWVSWIPSAVLTGLKMIRQYKPEAVWSTYPIATSHIVARVISRLSGLPWVADFRDPMVEQNPRTGGWAPSDTPLRKTRLWVESKAVKYADRLVFCTDAARSIVVQRYGIDASRCVVISNGYEEAVFREAASLTERRAPGSVAPFKLLHSGTVYPTADRDPRPFFAAIAALRDQGLVSAQSLSVVLRATGHDDTFRPLIAEYGIEGIVHLEPPRSYVEALTEMLDADGLLVMQGYTSNPAIPAKLYEYLRARRPIFALVDPAGSTAKLLEKERVGTLCSLEDSESIKHALVEFLGHAEETSRALETAVTQQFSREALTSSLAQLLNDLAE